LQSKDIIGYNLAINPRDFGQKVLFEVR